MSDWTRSFIRVNGQKLYLDEDRLDENEFEGFDGDDEQCDGCGMPLAEEAIIKHAKTIVKCSCGMEYEIELDPLENHGPPFDHATATGMYDRD